MLTVTDANGCQDVKYYTIDEPKAFNVVLTAFPDCNGENAHAEIREVGVNAAFDNSDPDYGGYTIHWRGPNGEDTDASNSTTADKLKSGTYTVSMTGKAQACAVVMTIPVPEKLEVLDYSVIDQTCAGINDGEIQLNVAGGTGDYSYTWSGINVNNDNGDHQVMLQQGTYTVKVADYVGTGSNRTLHCETPELTIQVGSKYGFDVIPATSDVSCFGNTDGTISLTVKNGSGDYTYEWSGSGMGIVEGASSQAALGKGSYTVVVTDNQLGCKATKSNLVVNSPKSALTVDVLSVKNITCPGKVNAGNGGSIKLRISGGTTYTDAAQNGYYLVKVNGALVSCDKVSSGKLYSGNDASRANEYILDFFGQGASTASLASGDYHFDVTDLSGCSATADVSISQS